MFDRSYLHVDIDTFDDALPRDDGGDDDAMGQGSPTLPLPIKLRKSLGERFNFLSLNIVVGPPLFTLCLSVAAQGMREMVPVMRTRLYRLPFPGIENLRDYQGFSELDLSHLASALLFLAVTFIWVRVLAELKGYGEVMGYRKTSVLIFGLYAGIAIIILGADAFVFYVGLASQGDGWNETPFYVPVGCTLLYAAGLAAFGAVHQNYHQPNHA
ncbi:hypothetical protein [Rhodopirellula bahusiensis]|uniref:hypothetical protein n=1 Tax=Rhodopirellula bahusiensis TaxID=2014065 RepID=UPI00326471F3